MTCYFGVSLFPSPLLTSSDISPYHVVNQGLMSMSASPVSNIHTDSEDTSAISRIQHPKKRAFLAAFCKCGSVTRAASKAKVSRHSHMHWMREDPLYVEAFAEAKEVAIQSLE